MKVIDVDLDRLNTDIAMVERKIFFLQRDLDRLKGAKEYAYFLAEQTKSEIDEMELINNKELQNECNV